MNKILRISVAVLLLCSILLCGCQQTEGSAETTLPSKTEYTVSVVDGAGNPYTSGIVVLFMKDGQQAAMQAINSEGKVTKELETGDYTVQLQFTGDGDGYFYDKESLTLSAEKTQLKVELFGRLSGDPVAVFDADGESNAYPVGVGSTYIKLEQGRRNYFLFNAPKAGVYRFTTSDAKVALGNYGYTNYIQKNSISEVKDNVMEITVTASMVGADGAGNALAIGLDPNEVAGCVLVIERIGDPPYSIEENEPWVIYETTVELEKYTLPEGTIQEFDLTAESYTLVFNEEDQFYHLNTADGPLVLVRLNAETTYLTSFAEVTSRTGVKKYFYDENGKFVKREDYTQCIKDYVAVSDDVEGVYPLTEDMKYIIQGHGEYVGWWDTASPSFIFEDDNGNMLPGLNPEVAWLFACCYLEQN